jgi:hypothetical protein
MVEGVRATSASFSTNDGARLEDRDFSPGRAYTPFSDRPGAGAMNCPQCGITDVIEIQHTLPDETEVVFFSCHRCEEKWWDRSGETLDLRDVLDMVRKPRS